MRQDTYQTVTDKIIAALEAGVQPWRQPWAAGADGQPIALRPLRANGASYKGINILLLWAAQQAAGYSSPYWCTYKQCAELGGQVRKGERSTAIVYFQMLERTRSTTEGDENTKIPMLREYRVFNADQCDNLPERFYAKPAAVPAPVASAVNEPIAAVEAFFAATGATVHIGGSKACYVPSADIIRMPALNAFESTAAYYGTLSHEFVHWTSAKTRLDRDLHKRWGDETYAFEELIAELGSCFVCADLEISCELEQNAAYIQHWLKILRNDKKAIFQAASMAQKASDFLNSFSVQASAESEDSEQSEAA